LPETALKIKDMINNNKKENLFPRIWL
jgi:hypothetical protein